MASISNPPFASQLLRHPPPCADEFLPGYLLRVAEANGYDNWHWISRRAGLSPSFGIKAADLAPLAQIVGARKTILNRMCWWPVDGDERIKIHRVGSGHLHRSALRPHDPKYCPHCLTESGHMRFWWSLAVVPACPKHRVLLLDHCPSCGKPMEWKRPETLCCPCCGSDYRKAKAPKASDRLVTLSSFFLQALGAPSGTDFSKLPEVFTGLSADLAAELVYLLGGYATGLAKGKAHRLMAKATTQQVIDVFAGAGAILLDWPNGFRGLLRQVGSRQGISATNSGLEREFGPFYKALHALRHKDCQFLHQEFSAYIQQEWSGGFLTSKNTRLATATPGSRRFVTRAEAARLLKIRPENLIRLLDRGQLQGVRRQMGKRQMVLIVHEGLSCAQSHVAELVTGKQIGNLLGLSKGPVRAILYRNLLRPARGPGIDGYCQPMYRRSDVEMLLGAVLGDAPPGREADDIISMESAIRKVTAVGLTIADIVQEVLCGRVQVAAQDIDQPGLKRALFIAADVEAMIQRNHVASGHRHTLPETAHRLGLKQQVLYHLVNVGLVASTQEQRGSRTIRMVEADERHRFSQTYISAAEIAMHLRTSPRSAVEEMRQQGITPITGPGVDGGRQWFFLHNAITAPA